MIRTSSAVLVCALAAGASAPAHSEPDKLRAAWEAGQDASNLGHYAEARRHFGRARDADPRRPGPYRWLGRIARVLEDWDDCVVQATTAVRLKPDSPQVAEVKKDLELCRAAL